MLQADLFTIVAEIIIVILVIRGIYVKLRYRRPNLRIFLSAIFVGIAYILAVSPSLPEHGISPTVQKLSSLSALILSIVPLFYKSQKRERIPFSPEIRGKILDKQNHKCAICGKPLMRFNIDFDHINGNRSDNRISNCRALCTPCHRRRHARDDD